MKKINWLLISLAATIAVFTYLTIHHYALKLGLGTDSLCSISSKINCDAAATSNYSELFGMPISILGGVFHFILFSFVLFYKLDWVDNTTYLQKTLRSLFAGAALASVIFALISFLIIKVICPFCFLAYALSIINLALGWNLVQHSDKNFSIFNYFGEFKSHLIALACVPVFSWVATGMIQNSYGLDEMNKYIPAWIATWKNNPQFNFDTTIGLSNKVTEPRIHLVEFADFKCPHCKVAAATIDVFLKSNPDVSFTFKPYPLDGTCNKALPHKGDASRCVLAAITLCAEKIANKGFEMHKWIFEKQEELIPISDIKSYLPKIKTDLNIDTDALTACADSAETYEQINKSAAEGSMAKIEGTPAIFMNGKMLPRGHFLEVLRQAAKQ